MEGFDGQREFDGVGNLTGQVRNIAEVATRRGEGRSFAQDHGRRAGEILQLKDTINTMVDQLQLASPSEVTRVAREVGTEGELGGQAQVPGVAGTWKDLTDYVNSMASNLTGSGAQHRGGDDRGGQRRSFPQDHRGREGEILRTERTPSTRWWISSMSFASEVTPRGARGGY